MLPALEDVLAEPDVQAADHIGITGGMAAGPHSVEVLDPLHGLGRQATLTRGNADSLLVAAARDAPIEVPDEIIRSAASQLRSADWRAVRRTPVDVAIYIIKGSKICSDNFTVPN